MHRAARIDMSKAILLTGADGFTGRHLTRAAAARGYRVLALKSDLLNPDALASELSGTAVDYVIHLAAISAVTHADELDLYRVNVFGTLNLLQALSRQAQIPSRVVIASSANVYGNTATSPISELCPPAPVNHYAMSKLAMEHMSAQFQDRLPLVTVRPFNYTGEGHDLRFVIPKLVHHFIRRNESVELGNLDVEREFNDVRTVCGMYLDLLVQGAERQVYNLCSGRTYTLTQVIDTLAHLTGYRPRIGVNPEFVRTNEVQRLCGDSAKLEAAIGKIEHPPLEHTLSWMLQSAVQ
jgi:nucleoside-diphosphate-sugar epimerase